MKPSVKAVLGLVLFAAVLGAAYLAYRSLSKAYKPDTAPQSGTESSYAAPDFTVYDADGQTVKLSDYRGKPVVLNFWASWCPPCKSEMPHFNDVYQEYRDDVVFMMVDMVDGQRETQAKGAQYIEEKGFTFPVYFDNDQSAADTYGISSIPTTIFIDSQGYIVTGYQGAIDKETLVDGIQLIK